MRKTALIILAVCLVTAITYAQQLTARTLTTGGTSVTKIWDGTQGVTLTYSASEQIIAATANDLYLRDSSNNGFVAQNAIGGGYLSVGGANTYAFKSEGLYPTVASTGGLGIASKPWNFVAAGSAVAGQPTCDSTRRGYMMVIFATGGNSDTLQACMKAAADTYAWRTVFTAP